MKINDLVRNSDGKIYKIVGFINDQALIYRSFKNGKLLIRSVLCQQNIKKLNPINNKISINSLSIGDKVWICSTDCGIMKPNKEEEIFIDKQKLNLLKKHSKLNHVFATKSDMVYFINKYNS